MRDADFVESGFQQGEVTELADRRATLADGTEKSFDIVVVATGSSYKSFQIAKSHDAVKITDRAAQMASEHERLKAAKDVLIIGGVVRSALNSPAKLRITFRTYRSRWPKGEIACFAI